MASRALSVAAGLPLAASGAGGQIVKVVFRSDGGVIVAPRRSNPFQLR